jgi:hypothetical protein
MRDATEPEPLKAWKREKSAEPIREERPMMCGGPEYTRRERLEMFREMRRERLEAEARAERERQEAEEREAAKKRAAKAEDEEDEYKAAERFRNDRYSVKLLRQDDDAWGGGGAGSGMLG